jgi:single-strand selective monofunctional uracil DNA glycosylase
MNLIVDRTKEFAFECARIEYPENVYVYHPLIYAWDFHRKYLERYVKEDTKALFLGMNPGPFGMAQTGIPFGEVDVVEEYLHIDEQLHNLPITHPKRPIDGLNCARSEVSGRRLWALIKERYPLAHMFPPYLAIMNYCPVVFVDKGPTGKNIIPEKIEKEVRMALENVCDSYLDDIISIILPHSVIGIGQYAKKKLEQSISRLEKDIYVTSILHPSPANPKANRGWAVEVEKVLIEENIWSER